MTKRILRLFPVVALLCAGAGFWMFAIGVLIGGTDSITMTRDDALIFVVGMSLMAWWMSYIYEKKKDTFW